MSSTGASSNHADSAAQKMQGFGLLGCSLGTDFCTMNRSVVNPAPPSHDIDTTGLHPWINVDLNPFHLGFFNITAQGLSFHHLSILLWTLTATRTQELTTQLDKGWQVLIKSSEKTRLRAQQPITKLVATSRSLVIFPLTTEESRMWLQLTGTPSCTSSPILPPHSTGTQLLHSTAQPSLYRYHYHTATLVRDHLQQPLVCLLSHTNKRL